MSELISLDVMISKYITGTFNKVGFENSDQQFSEDQ